VEASGSAEPSCCTRASAIDRTGTLRCALRRHHELADGELESLLGELRVGLTDEEAERLLAVVGQLRAGRATR
jgi:hypothetical protein